MHLKIHSLVSSRGYLMAVFRIDGKLWQFRVVTPDGATLGEEKVDHTVEAAEDAARFWLKA